jgi:hypothetical protein
MIQANNSRETTWEQRIWTIAQISLVGAMMWVASTVMALTQAVTRIEVRLETAGSRLSALETAATTGMDDRYRGRDAARDWDIQDKRDKTQDDRLNAQAAAIQDLRNRIGR